MKNNYLTASFIFNIACVGFLAYTFYFYNANQCLQTSKIDSTETENNHPKDPYKIAIFTPASHPSLDKIEAGFKDGLTKEMKVNCQFDTYNGNGSPTLMHAQAEEIFDKNYDLIFTIGAKTSQMAKEASLRKNRLLPIVFGAVARPEELNLIASREHTENHLTGITADPDYQLQMTMLHFINPNIKRILLIYDPTQSSGLEYDKNVSEKVLNSLGVELKAVEVYKTNDIYSKISSQTDDVDAVLIFKDNTVVSSIDSIIKHCNRIGIPLCVTELDSVPKGASIGFSITSYDAGVESSYKAYNVLVEGKHPSQIPVTQAKNFKIMVNKKTMLIQKLTQNPQLNQLILSLEAI